MTKTLSGGTSSGFPWQSPQMKNASVPTPAQHCSSCFVKKAPCVSRRVSTAIRYTACLLPAFAGEFCVQYTGTARLCKPFGTKGLFVSRNPICLSPQERNSVL